MGQLVWMGENGRVTTRGGSHAMRPTGSPRWGRRALLVGGVAVAGYAGFAVWPRSEGDPSPTPPTTSAPEATDSASPSGSTAAGRFPGDPGDKVYLGVSLSIDQPLSEKAAEIGSSPTMTRRFYKDHQVGLMSSMATQDIEQGALPFLMACWQASMRREDRSSSPSTTNRRTTRPSRVIRRKRGRRCSAVRVIVPPGRLRR